MASDLKERLKAQLRANRVNSYMDGEDRLTVTDVAEALARITELEDALRRIQHEAIIRAPATAVQTVSDMRAIAREALGDKPIETMARAAEPLAFVDGSPWADREGAIALQAAALTAAEAAGYWLVPVERGEASARLDALTTKLYRRFKDWNKRGFGPDDVTWCEVRADLAAMLAAQENSTSE